MISPINGIISFRNLIPAVVMLAALPDSAASDGLCISFQPSFSSQMQNNSAFTMPRFDNPRDLASRRLQFEVNAMEAMIDVFEKSPFQSAQIAYEKYAFEVSEINQSLLVHRVVSAVKAEMSPDTNDLTAAILFIGERLAALRVATFDEASSARLWTRLARVVDPSRSMRLPRRLISRAIPIQDENPMSGVAAAVWASSLAT